MPFVQVELGLHLLYIMGEHLDQKLPDWIVRAVSALITSDVSNHPHKCVTVVYHDVIDRYSQVAIESPTLIPAVITAYLDNRGLQHPHPQVRGRSAYLLKRTVKRLRNVPTLMQHSEILVRHMQDVLKVNGSGAIAYDDKLQVFQVLGMLICSDAFPEQQQVTQLAEALSSTVHLLEQLPSNPLLHSDLLLQQQLGCAVEVIANFLKSCPRNSSSCGVVFGGVLQLLAGSVQRWPILPDLNLKVLFFLHRIVDNFGPHEALPSLRSLLPVLLQNSRSKDEVLKVLLLVNQIAMRYRAAAFEMLDELFLAIIRQIQGVMGSASPSTRPGETASDEQRDAAELQKAYIDLVQHLAGHDLASVLVSNQNRSCLESILQSIIECACNGAPEAQRSSFLTLRLLIEQWGSTEVFNPVIQSQILPVSYRCLLAPSLSITTGDFRLLLPAIAGLQYSCNVKLGGAVVAQVLGEVLPQFGVPVDVAVAYAQQMGGLNTEPDVKTCLKAFLQQAKS